MNPIGNYRGETAKSLRVCKIVLDGLNHLLNRLSYRVTYGLDKYLSPMRCYASTISRGQNSAYRYKCKNTKNTLSKAGCFSFIGAVCSVIIFSDSARIKLYSVFALLVAQENNGKSTYFIF